MGSLIVVGIMSVILGVILGAVSWTMILIIAEKHEQVMKDSSEAEDALSEK